VSAGSRDKERSVAIPVIDTPQALDDAIAAGRQARRNALARTARGHGVRIADVLGMLVVLLALAQIFIDPTRALFPGTIACLAFGSIYISRKTRRQNAIEALRDCESLK
jgi:hypothetical protein